MSPSPHVANTGVGREMSFASFLSFWAVAANELIFGSARPAEAQSVEPEDALQMGDEYMPNITDHPDNFYREWAYRRGNAHGAAAVIAALRPHLPLKSGAERRCGSPAR